MQNITRAAKAELVQHAVERLGLDEAVANEMTREDLIAFIRENDVEMQESQPAKAGVAHPSKQKKVKLIIHEQEGVIGRQPVEVSVDGYASQIKRGKEVEVPESVVNVLRDAVITAYEPDPDSPGKYLVREYPRFNFSVRG